MVLINTNYNKITKNSATNNSKVGIYLSNGTNSNDINWNILKATNGLKDEGKNISHDNVVD